MSYKHDLEYIISSVGSPTIEKFNGKVILLTGCNGFIGKWFQDIFEYINQNILTKKCLVLCFDNNIVSKKRYTSSKYIKCNISDINDIYAHIDKFNIDKIDYIINCAGIASPKIYRKYPLETLDVSYLGTKNILDISIKYNPESVLCFSSSEIYGTPRAEHIPTTEDCLGEIPTMSSRSCYDVGKEILETLCYVYNTEYNVPVKVLRPFNLYGPQMGLNDNRVLSNFILNVLHNKYLNIYGDGKQTRTFCYIADGIIGMLKLLDGGRNGEVYNIGNPKPEINMHDLALKVCKLTNHEKLNIVPHPDFYPSDEPLRRCPDISKISKGVGYEPKIGLDEGLLKMYNYYKNGEIKHANKVS
jgi:UDP-glucuronate decarboxylase